MMFPHKVSVFNIKNTDDEEIITKTLLIGVLFVKNENTSRGNLGLSEDDTVGIYIPKKVDSNGSKYINPFEYELLPKEDLSKFYTFNKGDYVAFGDISIVGVSVNDFKNRYGNLYEITKVSDYNYGGLKHFEIGAR